MIWLFMTEENKNPWKNQITIQLRASNYYSIQFTMKGGYAFLDQIIA